MIDLLDLPPRSAKPRQQGVTHVLDRGLSLRQVQDLLEVAVDAVDVVKLGWGTSLVTDNLERKLAAYREAEIPVVLGGTLTELAIARGRLGALIDWIRQLGLKHIEISDGTITIPHEHKLDLIRQRVQQQTLARRGHTGDPLYGIRRTIHIRIQLLSASQYDRLTCVLDAEQHLAVKVAYVIDQKIIAAYADSNRRRGKQLLPLQQRGFRQAAGRDGRDPG